MKFVDDGCWSSGIGAKVGSCFSSKFYDSATHSAAAAKAREERESRGERPSLTFNTGRLLTRSLPLQCLALSLLLSPNGGSVFPFTESCLENPSSYIVAECVLYNGDGLDVGTGISAAGEEEGLAFQQYWTLRLVAYPPKASR